MAFRSARALAAAAGTLCVLVSSLGETRAAPRTQRGASAPPIAVVSQPRVRDGRYVFIGGTTYGLPGKTIPLLWLRSLDGRQHFVLEVDKDTKLSGLGVPGTVLGPQQIRTYLLRGSVAHLALARRPPTVACFGDPTALVYVGGVAAALRVVPPPGFRPLFNGKDLTGWQGLVELPERQRLAADPEKLAARQKQANEAILPHWTVRDGVLHYDGRANSLQTARDYGDFELILEYKIGPHGDSGIYLRGSPQVQIWDPADHPEGSGGLYNNQKHRSTPLKCADRPAGQWNLLHIVMRGDRVTVYLNGELVVDNTPMENYWDRSQPLPATGPIELQHHGNPLEFRNIYIKEP